MWIKFHEGNVWGISHVMEGIKAPHCLLRGCSLRVITSQQLSHFFPPNTCSSCQLAKLKGEIRIDKITTYTSVYATFSFLFFIDPNQLERLRGDAETGGGSQKCSVRNRSWQRADWVLRENNQLVFGGGSDVSLNPSLRTDCLLSWSFHI